MTWVRILVKVQELGNCGLEKVWLMAWVRTSVKVQPIAGVGELRIRKGLADGMGQDFSKGPKNIQLMA